MATNKYTVRDVAKLSGVSPATVSRVINHRDLVDDETAAKVNAAMDELGYIAKATHTAPSTEKAIILINVEDKNPFYEDVLQGAITSANAHGFKLIANFDAIETATIGDFIGLVRKIHAAGIITLTQIRADILKQIQDVLPIIQCCEYNAETSVPHISIDDYAATQQAVKFLIQAGCAKIAMLNGPLSYKYARERLRAFQNTMHDANLSVPPFWLLQVPKIDYDMAYTVVSQFLSTPENRPDAFFATSDIFAAAVINAAAKLNIRVPQDMMVIGFDNLALCKMMHPAITSVNQPKFQLGYTACEYLINHIKNKRAPIQSVTLATNLIIRESAH